MTLALYDRVQETTATTGTGSITLAGAVSGYQSFAVVGDGNTCYYTIVNTAAWEVGIGTYSTTGPTLARTTVLSNSNGNTTPINLSGASNVFLTYPAEKSVNLDASGNVSPLGTVSSGTWNGSTVGVAYGGTGVTASSGANSVVLRDANQNISFNNYTAGAAAVTAAAGTTILTAASARTQILVGSTTQTFQLPDATTLALGQSFIFVNNSSGALTVKDNASATVETVPSGGVTQLGAVSIATSAGSWGAYSFIPAAVDWGTNSLNLATTVVSGGTWQGGAIGTAYGGTGLSGATPFTSGGAVYANSASTLTSGTLPVTAGGTGSTTSTGSGSVVLANSPALVTPALGTPASGNFSSGTFTWPTFNQNTTGSAGSVVGLTLNSSASGINPDSVTQNQLGYATSVSLFGQTDGGLYSSAYSSSWIHEIFGDFRTGQIAIRGKNSGTWQSWRTVLDSGNYTSYAPSLTGSGASGTWGIRITGFANAGSQRLYSTDSTYNYDSANPYFGYLTYDGSRWLFQVSPGTPASVRVAYSDNSGGLGGYAASSYLGYNGSSYYQANTWIQFNGTYGLYWPGGWGTHFSQNNTSTYTPFRMVGNKNTYDGMYLEYSSVNGMMYDGGGNGGVYREANGRWYFYYHLGNDCMGIGTSSTSSSYSIYVNKGAYLAGGTYGASMSISGGYTLDTPGSGYARANNWMQLNGSFGFYSPVNNAHIYPNDGSYGSWKIIGTRNGWGGIEFSTGPCLMVNDNDVGFYRPGYGWIIEWSNGTLYVAKSAYGGSNVAVLDTSNMSNWVIGQAGGATSGYGVNSWYTNSSGRALTIYCVASNSPGNGYINIYVSSTIVRRVNCYGTNSGCCFVVPNGANFYIEPISCTVSNVYYS